eukprot:m.112246 g.112246  ORF g.112246 m.112246 type:complete len:118 (-) comp21409_c0_seq4:35-388(-)
MGGSKEMRECVDGYTKCEAKIEAMEEFSKFEHAVRHATETPITRLAECKEDVTRLCADLQLLSHSWKVRSDCTFTCSLRPVLIGVVEHNVWTCPMVWLWSVAMPSTIVILSVLPPRA